MYNSLYKYKSEFDFSKKEENSGLRSLFCSKRESSENPNSGRGLSPHDRNHHTFPKRRSRGKGPDGVPVHLIQNDACCSYVIDY